MLYNFNTHVNSTYTVLLSRNLLYTHTCNFHNSLPKTILFWFYFLQFLLSKKRGIKVSALFGIGYSYIWMFIQGIPIPDIQQYILVYLVYRIFVLNGRHSLDLKFRSASTLAVRPYLYQNTSTVLLQLQTFSIHISVAWVGQPVYTPVPLLRALVHRVSLRGCP